MLVLGPSRRFLDYIAQVLPVLGETAVAAATCETLVPGVTAEREESRELAELKGRPLWQSSLTAYVRSLVPAPTVLDFLLQGESHTLPEQRIRRAVEGAVSGRDLHAARRWFVEDVHDLLTDAVVERHEELLAGVEDGFEDILARVDAGLAKPGNRGTLTGATGSDVDGTLTDDDIERLRIEVAGDRDVAGVLGESWPLYDPHVALTRCVAPSRCCT